MFHLLSFTPTFNQWRNRADLPVKYPLFSRSATTSYFQVSIISCPGAFPGVHLLPSSSAHPFSTHQPELSSMSPSCLTPGSGFPSRLKENPTSCRGLWSPPWSGLCPPHILTFHLLTPSSLPPAPQLLECARLTPRLSPASHELSLDHCRAGSSWSRRPLWPPQSGLPWPRCWEWPRISSCSRHSYQIILSFLSIEHWSSLEKYLLRCLFSPTGM